MSGGSSSRSVFRFNWKETLLPALFFPVLTAVAVQVLFRNILLSGTGKILRDQCALPIGSPEALYRLEYTRVPSVDARLCGLVTFFHAAMGPTALPLVAYAMSSLGSLALFPFIEAARKGRPIALATPVIWGLLTQVMTVAAIIPLYWMVFIFTGAASSHRRVKDDRSMIDHGQAEGVVFGLFLGSIIPTASMLVLQDPIVTAIWQVYPLWMSVSSFLHRLVRPNSESGYKTIQAAYLILFIFSSSSHIALVWPRLSDTQVLKQLFLPAHPHDIIAATSTLELGAMEFLKWDIAIALIATISGTFWFIEDVKQGGLLFLWYAVVIPLAGPGAAIAGVLLWRESVLNAKVLAVAKSNKKV